MALPLGDFNNPLAVQAIEPQVTESTPGEVLGATIGAAWDGGLTNRGVGMTARSFADGLPVSQGDGTYVSSDSLGLPKAPQITPEEANAKAKAAGVQVGFDKPMAADSAQSIIDDHVTQQQRADVISRNGNSILSGQVGRFVAGSLISLADPLNLAAMMIPAAPEAFVAEKLAAASGAFERAAIRGAAGAVNGAVGMAALEPLDYAMSKSDYNDWTAGDALRNIFMGAALGAGGHVLLGGLFGREHLPTTDAANTSMEATRAAIGQVADDRPVDVAGIPRAAEMSRAADELQAHSAPFDGGIDAFHGTPHEFDRFDTAHIGSGEGAQAFGHGLYFAENEGVARSYQEQLSGLKKTPETQPVIDARDAALREYNRIQDALSRHGNEDDPALLAQHDVATEKLTAATAALEALEDQHQGNLYRVKLNARPEELLHLDKSLSEQPAVMAKLEAVGIDTNGGAMSGKELHDTVAAEYKGAHPEYGNEGAPAQFAAEQLQKAGVKGIRYLDGDSRAEGDGSHNVVMFDHNDVQITHKNGVPVEQAVAALRAQADTAAKDMAERAMNPPADPAVEQAARVSKATVEAAPEFVGDVDKDAAELTKLTQDLHQQVQQEIASGRIIETQEMRDMMMEADHVENVGKASANYAACLAGRGVV